MIEYNKFKKMNFYEMKCHKQDLKFFVICSTKIFILTFVLGTN